MDRNRRRDQVLTARSAAIAEPLRVGVFVEQRLADGGGFQQSLNAALLVSRLPTDLCLPVYFSPHRETVEALKSLGLPAVEVRLGHLRRLWLTMRSRITYPPAVRLIRRLIGPNGLERVFEAHRIDLVYFLSPTEYARSLERLNYVYTIWDLCHRDEPEFPEVRYDREFERRESLYRNALPKASAVFADSDEGASRMVRRYGVDRERIHVMRSSPAPGTDIDEGGYRENFIDIKQKFDLASDYVFYPAQFWTHKNHVFILEALHALEVQHGIRLGAIFAGGDIGGNQAHVAERARALGLGARIKFAGFVAGELLPYLYRQSVALVMPTYFGPTNLPPLEALRLHTPVIYPESLARASDLDGVVLTIDLDDPQTLVQRLLSLLSDAPRDGATNEQRAGVLRILDDDSVRLANLTAVLTRFRRKRLCWA